MIAPTSIAKIIMSNPEFTKVERCFVSIYSVERCYGGSEEGGWWYSRSTIIGSVPFFSRDDAETYVSKIEKEVEVMQEAENAEFRSRAMAAWDRAEDRGEDLQDDFCSGESWDADQFSIIIEETRGSYDNSKEPKPQWE